jgi:endonuclease YncB( thermonuclease family)
LSRSALTASLCAAALAQTDGDTIKLNGTTCRLWGIDAPETKQWCSDYPAGALATGMLSKLMSGRAITCEDRGHDRYGRTIGLCRADGDDLSKAMVRLGMAWAYVRYSRDYVDQEEQARLSAWACTRTYVCRLGNGGRRSARSARDAEAARAS